jgi:hypothetical protein
VTTVHRAKILDWVRRYGLAECAGIACAVLASFAARRTTGSAVAAGYAGAWGETLGYATVLVVRDFLAGTRRQREASRPFTVRDGVGVMTGLLVEFGPAAIVDTFLTRPLAMAVGTRLLGLPLGVLTGKLVADALFYVPVIATYEYRKRKSSPEKLDLGPIVQGPSAKP